MKKCFIFFGAVMLFTAKLCNALAMESHILDFSITNKYEQVQSICWRQEELYVLTNKGIYTWDTNEKEIKSVYDMSVFEQYMYQQTRPSERTESALWEKAISVVFSDGEFVYGMQPYSGDIYTIDNDGLHKVYQVPDELLYSQGTETCKEIIDIEKIDEDFYILLSLDPYNHLNSSQLFWFHDEKATLIDADNVQCISRGPGETLVIAHECEKVSISVFDPAKQIVYDSLNMITGENLRGLVWNDADKHYVWISGGEIRVANEDGSLFTRAYTPVNKLSSQSSVSCSNKGMYAFSYGKHVFIQNVSGDTSLEQTVLRVSGKLNPELLIEFSVEYPNVIVQENNENRSPETSILSQDSEIDIFVLSAPGTFFNMKTKGYLAEIGDPNLTSWINSLYPEIVRVSQYNGQFVGVPINMRVNSWTINESVWNNLSIGDYPQTYEQLLSKVELWLNDYAEDYPDFTLSDIQQNGLDVLISSIIKEHVFQCEMNGKPIRFDDPSFEQTLTLIIEKISLFSQEHDQWGMPLLSSYSQGFGIDYSEGNRMVMILPPTLEENTPQFILSDLELIAISEMSSKKDIAQQFIAWYVKQLTETTKYKLSYELNEPVENQNYQTRLNELCNELIAYKNGIDNVSTDNERLWLVEEIDRIERQIETLANNRWSISQESISQYRRLADRIRIPDESIFFNSNALNDVDNIVLQFCERGLKESQLTVLVSELNRIANMVTFENQ